METADVLSPSVADASVRPASTADLPAIGAIHARAWTTAYRSLLPVHLVQEVTPEAMTEAWRPHLGVAGTRFHHLLVACTGPTVVGFAAFGPGTSGDAADPDGGDNAAPPDTGELVTMHVDAPHQRRGHGSRLLAAGVDLLRADGASSLVCWVPAVDDVRLAFLQSAGLRPDGAWRHLTGEPEQGSADAETPQLREVRLVASLDVP